MVLKIILNFLLEENRGNIQYTTEKRAHGLSEETS